MTSVKCRIKVWNVIIIDRNYGDHQTERKKQDEDNDSCLRQKIKKKYKNIN
jgi:hypothetical protein